MNKITITHNDGDKQDRYLFDITKEKCPLCDTPLKNTWVKWNVFHGEVNRSCCNSPWQTKDFCPPEGEEENYQEYFDEVNKPEMSELKIEHDLWGKIREAFDAIGVKDCRNKEVYEYIFPESKKEEK
jgi:hypothetical protein